MVSFMRIYDGAWPPSLWVRFKALLIFLLVVHLLLQGVFSSTFGVCSPFALTQVKQKLNSAVTTICFVSIFIMADLPFIRAFLIAFP
jgi:Mg/Co/Ni transporter MgtE